MRNDIDRLVTSLLSDLFQIPQERLRAAHAMVATDPDRSLLDVLSGMGALQDADRALLNSLLANMGHEEAPTRTRQPDEDGMAPDATASLPWPAGVACGGNDLMRYEVQGEHARGGMGRILTAWDRTMRREVVVKELLPEAGTNGDAGRRALARFLREARITGRLQHPSIVPVHDIGIRAGGACYYTMKLIRGKTLRQAIADAGSLDARMALLPHYRDLCLAVAYAHAHGVIHRDIKPSNVMIGEFGETQVIDWGLARELEAPSGGVDSREPGAAATLDVTDADLTRGGQFLGTPHYMPPEQAAGQLELLDERSDVYSLGAVLYELLTGERPYQATSGLEVLGRVSEGPPTPPEALCPGAPPALVAICRRAMARDPAHRYPTAGSIAAEVEDFQAGLRVSAHDYSVVEIVSLFFRRHRPAVLTACIAAVLLLALGAYTYAGLRTRHAVEHDLRIRSDQKRYDMAILLAQDALDGYRYGEARQLLEGAPDAYRNWEWGYLNQMLDAVQDRIATDQGRIIEVLVHPNGQNVVTVDAAGGAQLRALPSGEHLLAYARDGGAVAGAAIHPDGSEFALRLERGGVRRWETESGAPLPGFDLGPGATLRYATGGDAILAGADGGELLQWDPRERGVVRHFSTGGGTINDLAHARDARWLAAATSTGGVHVWDWGTGAPVFQASAHPDRQEGALVGALQVAFNPDSTLMVTTGGDTDVKLWNTGDWTLKHTLSRHLMRVLSAEFSPDGTTLMTQSARVARFWDPRSGRDKPSWIRGDRSYVRMRYSADGTRLLAAGDGDGVTLWNLNAPPSGQVFQAHTAEVNAVRFSPDSRFLISGAGHWLNGGDSRVLAWDLQLGPRPVAAGIFPTDARWVNQVSFHPVEPQMTAVESHGNIVTWDCDTGDRVRTIHVPEYTRGARCMTFSADGALMATAGWDAGNLATVTLWDARTGARLRELHGAEHFIERIAFSPDAGELAAGSRDGMVHIWTVSDGQYERRFPLEEGWVCGVAFAPHGRLLAASCDSSAVLLLDPDTGDVRHRLDGMNLRANNVVFSPDGQRVAACDARVVRIWNAENGAPLLAIPFGARDVAFSPDGATLAAGGFDGRIGLWRASGPAGPP